MWNSFRILWDQQVLILWTLLLPTFLAVGLLALLAPYLPSKKR